MLNITNLRYRYPNRTDDTLKNINLHLKKGEMALLAGCSGCGKSTLIKAVGGILQMENRGMIEGDIYLDGKNVLSMAPEDIGLLLGIVYQTPDDQLFAMTVYDEVAFALENQGYEDEFIKNSVFKTLELAGLKELAYASVHALSGGQRQRLALASVLATRPKVLVLDEPVSQMNPQSACDFLQFLTELNRSQGLTVLLIEHRVNELARYFKRIAVMRTGKIVYDGSVDDVWAALADEPHIGLREPQNISLCKILKLPAYSNDTNAVVDMIRKNCKIGDLHDKRGREFADKKIFSAESVFYKYDGADKDTLLDLNFCLREGEITALMGFNGAGKSTLMNLIGGLNKSYRGRFTLNGKLLEKNLFEIGYLRQEADLMLLADTVKEEFCWNNKSLTDSDYEKLIAEMGLEKYSGDFPLALSKGQRLRVILGAILARKPKLLLLDEPTTGQDQQSLDAIKLLLLDYAKQGGCVFFCTHDVELAAEIADRVIIMAAGRIVVNSSAREALANKNYLTAGGLSSLDASDVAEKLNLPPCLTAKEVSEYVHATALGG